jgi:Zn-dependent peptidase ImmA (M78 family)
MDELIRVSKEVLSYLNSQRGMLVRDYAYDLAKAISVAEKEKGEMDEQVRNKV